MRTLGKTLHTISRIDWWFFGPMLFLIVLGLVMQYSLGINQDQPSLVQFYKQLTFVFIGLAAAVGLLFVDYRSLKAHPVMYLIIGILLLLLVLLFGTTIKGTTGWFVLAGISLQPVELVKLCLILFLASYFEKSHTIIRTPRYLFAAGGSVGALVALVVLQPDLGSAIILFCIWLGFMLVLRAPAWFLALVGVAVGALYTLGWFFVFEDYQRDRLTTFLNPEADPLGAGYNVTQSITAIGSGGFWGRGLGLGTQSQLRFLPEVNSDFIFAAIAEELGFIVAALLLLAIATILYRLWRYMQSASSTFALLVLLGVFTYLLMQSLLTIGMNLGLLPVTGLPLPLVSAGGSSMVVTLFMLGLAHRIGSES